VLKHGQRKLFELRNYEMEVSPLLIIAPAFFNTQLSVTGIPGVPPLGTGTSRSPRKFDTVSVAYVMYLTYFITVYIIHAKLHYSRILEPSMDCPASCPLQQLVAHLPIWQSSPFHPVASGTWTTIKTREGPTPTVPYPFVRENPR
jgi:hypothetical protein